jgi:hypothetical protein
MPMRRCGRCWPATQAPHMVFPDRRHDGGGGLSERHARRCRGGEAVRAKREEAEVV